jgi:hypothetical protein
LFANCNLLDHVPKVDGFFSLYLREANDCTSWLYTATNGLSPLKDFLGVSQISRAASPGDWEARDTFMPLLTAGQEPVFVDDSIAFQRLIRDDFEPRKVVCLPPEAKQTVTATRRPEAKVSGFQFSAERVVANVEASAPTMVVVAQAFYHPWHAYVDGRAVRVWRANYAFQAIEVPAGSHQVGLVYEDRSFSIGAIMSVWSALLCAMLLRTNEAEPSEN